METAQLRETGSCTSEDYINLEDLSGYTCFTNPWNCTGSATLSVWIKLPDTPDGNGILTSLSTESSSTLLLGYNSISMW